MSQSHSSKTPKIIGAIVITGVVAIAIMILVIKPQQETNETSTEPVAITSQTTVPETTTVEDGSITGIHSGSVTYAIPKGFVNDIQVSLTFDDGIVTDVAVLHEYEDEESKFYIDNFDAGVEESIVGKFIEDISSANINGASLTSDAFYDVVDVIVKDAEASI